jgi:hypothetical protein
MSQLVALEVAVLVVLGTLHHMWVELLEQQIQAAAAAVRLAMISATLAATAVPVSSS